MTDAALALLNAFDQLSDEDRQEVVEEILRRSIVEENGEDFAEFLTQVADELFDELEQQDPPKA